MSTGVSAPLPHHSTSAELSSFYLWSIKLLYLLEILGQPFCHTQISLSVPLTPALPILAPLGLSSRSSTWNVTCFLCRLLKFYSSLVFKNYLPIFLSKHVSKSSLVILLELITLLATVSQHFFVSLVRLGQLCFVTESVAHICLLQGILNNSSAGVVAFENLGIYIVFCSLYEINQCFRIKLKHG